MKKEKKEENQLSIRLVRNIDIAAVDLAKNIEMIRQMAPVSFPGIVII